MTTPKTTPFSDIPLPQPDEVTAGFWAHTARHQLAFQQCDHCGTFAHPPVLFCSQCHELEHPAFTFRVVSGRGTILSWTVIHDAIVRGFGPDPWMLAFVQMEEQPQLRYVATIIDGPDAPIEIGSSVEVAFVDVGPDLAIPVFRLAPAEMKSDIDLTLAPASGRPA